MKIGLISDTHDNIQNIQNAISLFNNRRVSFVIHAGDIVSPKAVEAFTRVNLVGVLGNNDLDVSALNNAFDKIGGQLKGEFCEIEYDDLIFAIYHGTNPRKNESIDHRNKSSLIICFFSHIN